MEVFKIRRRADGLFSSGGSWPHFSPKGKVWKRQGDVTNHIHQVDRRALYTDCDVIRYEVVETINGATPVGHWQAAADARKAEKERVRKEKQEAAKKRERQNQYESLKREFG